LMGAAALGGGLVVRYSDHPMEITLAHAVPPEVVSPPIPPAVRVGPSNSVPVHSAPRDTGTTVPEPEALRAQTPPDQKEKPAKPSAFSPPERNPAPRPAEPRYVARTRIPPEPPAVIPLESPTIPPSKPITVVVPSNRAAAKEVTSNSAQAPATSTPTLPPAPAPPAAPAPAAAATPGPNRATLRAGMLISVRISQALSSNLNSQGDVFSGSLDRPLIADGFVIAERGAKVRGEVVESKSTGGIPELSIRLREVLASDGQRVHLVSEPWRKLSSPSSGTGTVYDVALTRGGAAVIRPATSITFRLDQTVEVTEKQ